MSILDHPEIAAMRATYASSGIDPALSPVGRKAAMAHFDKVLELAARIGATGAHICDDRQAAREAFTMAAELAASVDPDTFQTAEAMQSAITHILRVMARHSERSTTPREAA